MYVIGRGVTVMVAPLSPFHCLYRKEPTPLLTRLYPSIPCKGYSFLYLAQGERHDVLDTEGGRVELGKVEQYSAQSLVLCGREAIRGKVL